MLKNPCLREAGTAAAVVLREFFTGWCEPMAFLSADADYPLDWLFDAELGRLPLSELPGFPTDMALPGNAGFVLGTCGDVQILVCHGNPLLNSGFGVLPCILPVCAAVCAGINNINILGTANGIRDGFKPGTFMVLTDYINGFGLSPLAGRHGLGADMIVDMRLCFSQELNSEFVNAAAMVGLEPRLGTMQSFHGPELPTVLEVQAAHRNGVDAMGQGVVLEIITACAMGAKTMGLVLVTDFSLDNLGPVRSLQEKSETCAFIAPTLNRALRLYFSGLG